ncbi:MAG: hypothetical protein RR681_09395 [Lachnospiraceae bacterium]
MKHLLLLIVAVFSFTGAIAQKVDLKTMNEKQKNEYLIRLGEEACRKFGPGYYRNDVHPVITEGVFNSDDKRTEIKKNIGREYYIVTFPYDRSKEKLDFNYSSMIKIWKDSGEPLEIIFGNGYGKNFLFLSYKEQIDSRAVIDVIPYQQSVESQENIWE